jgi:hypothetical protein
MQRVFVVLRNRPIFDFLIQQVRPATDQKYHRWLAGRMGTDRVTVQNLRVIKIDRGRNLLFVEGAVPGNKGNFVEIRDAVKKPLWRTDKVLDGMDRPPLPTFESDESIDGCGQGGHEAFMPIAQKDPLAPDVDDDA